MSAWCQDEVLPKDSRAAFILVQPRIPGFYFIRLFNFWALPWGGRGSAESPAARPQEFFVVLYGS